MSAEGRVLTHEHEWIESAPGTGLGEPVAHCRCGLYRTTPADGGYVGADAPERSAFEMFKARHGTAGTATAPARTPTPDTAREQT